MHRPLSAHEVREAEKVFGTSLDYGRVRIVESVVMTVGRYARTPFETIYFPRGAVASPTFMAWLIHELTHAWQTQHGIAVTTKVWRAMQGTIGNPYAYGGQPGLRDAIKNGRHFCDFNTEQQGDICRDYYLALGRGAETTAFDPFIRELQGLPPTRRRRRHIAKKEGRR